MLYRIDCWNNNAKEMAMMLKRNWFNDAVAIGDRFVEVSGSAQSAHTFELLVQQHLNGDPLDYIVETIG